MNARDESRPLLATGASRLGDVQPLVKPRRRVTLNGASEPEERKSSNCTSTTNMCNGNPDDAFVTNGISTAKYSVLSFIPKFLCEQLAKVANIYFLFMIVLQTCPYTSISGGVPTVAMPLVFVIFVAMVKELFEDWARRNGDWEQNHRPTTRIHRRTAQPTTWEEVTVGTLLVVHDGESFPADALLLASTVPDGAVWLETKELDGETTLKEFRACGPTASSVEDVTAISGVMSAEEQEVAVGCHLIGMEVMARFEPPNAKLDAVEGSSVTVENTSKGVVASAAVRKTSLALRGSVLRDTGSVWCMVVYTGRETKIMMNASPTPSKRSTVDLQTDRLLLWLLLTQILISLFSAAIAGYFEYDEKELWYLGSDRGLHRLASSESMVYRPFMFMVIYMYLIPIALYVSLEMIRFVQAQFMMWDINMYDPETDTTCLVRTSALNEELGRVQYVFSDKTGTLTANTMSLSALYVNGTLYNDRTPEALDLTWLKQQLEVECSSGEASPRHTSLEQRLRARLQELGSLASTLKSKGHGEGAGMAPGWLVQCINSTQGGDEAAFRECVEDQIAVLASRVQHSAVPHVELSTTPIKQALQGGDAVLADFVMCMACCNSVKVSSAPSKDETAKTTVAEALPLAPEYNAMSPDELALVYGAHACGVTYLSTGGGDRVVVRHGTAITVHMPVGIEFDSTRKRSSNLCRVDGQWRVYVKGADNVMLELLRAKDPMRAGAMKALSHFSRAGLRTLLFGVRVVEESVALRWVREFEEGDGQQDVLDRLAGEMEQDLVLLGATAVDDKLQVGVPDTLELLAQMGVKTWVLTGDKQETAISIGFSSRLLNTSMRIMVEEWPKELSHASLAQCIEEMHSETVRLLKRDAEEDATGPALQHALVVDGAILQVVFTGVDKDADLSDKDVYTDLAKNFLALAQLCSSVIVCRASPLQKAQVVSLVKCHTNAVTLAIGDGANDAGMIQQAHIGVGVQGKEGSQAVNVADYAIGQFRFLRELTLVHGRHNYQRQVSLVLYMFYKSFAIVVPTFLFQTVARFSAQECYEFPAYQFFNTLFTSLPIMVLGIWDVDFVRRVALKHPELYSMSQTMRDFTAPRFGVWLANGLWHGACAFLVYVSLFESWYGSVYLLGFYLFTNIVVIVNARIMIMLGRLRWSWISLSAVLFSLLSYFLFELFVDSEIFANAGPLSVYTGTAYYALDRLTLWFSILGCTVFGLLPIVVKRAVEFMFFPGADELQTVLEEERAFIDEENSKTLAVLQSHAESMVGFLTLQPQELQAGKGAADAKDQQYTEHAEQLARTASAGAIH